MGRLPRLRRAVVFGAVLAAVLGTAASASRDQSDKGPALYVAVGSPYAPFRADVQSAAGPGIASRLEIDVPAGYTISLPSTRGANAGVALFQVSNATSGGGGGASFGDVELSVDDPAAYTSDPAAQACAPGAHAAVLSGMATLGTQTLRLLIFLDPASGGGQALLVCPSGVEGTAQVTTRLDLILSGPVTVPHATGTYVWRALVTPRGGSAYELRAVARLPSSVAFAASYDSKHREAVLSGRVLAGNRPLAKATVSFDVTVGHGTSSDSRNVTTTSSDGRFAFRIAIKKSSDYIANVETEPEACTPPYAAPGGCFSQTAVAPDPVFATVFVAGRLDAKRVYTSAGKSRAASEQLRASDLPDGSAVLAPGVHTCETKHASEAKLTVSGEAQSPLYGLTSAATSTDPGTFQFLEASATTRVYKSTADAKAALTAEATLTTARCMLDAQTGSASKSTAGFPQQPATIRAFVDKVDLLGPSGTMELVFIQRGRSVAKLFVFGAGTPTRPVALDLARKLAVRLR